MTEKNERYIVFGMLCCLSSANFRTTDLLLSAAVFYERECRRFHKKEGVLPACLPVSQSVSQPASLSARANSTYFCVHHHTYMRFAYIFSKFYLNHIYTTTTRKNNKLYLKIETSNEKLYYYKR